MITKGERSELRSLLRQRFKVLRADVAAREAELLAELEARITAQFAESDKAWSDAMYLIEEAARDANRKANDILRGLGRDDIDLDGKDYTIISARTVNQPTSGRGKLRAEGNTRITAKVKAALLELDRQEAELLTRLVTDALESTEARQFLNLIPTVSSLVPADRLLALEATLNESRGGAA